MPLCNMYTHNILCVYFGDTLFPRKIFFLVCSSVRMLGTFFPMYIYIYIVCALVHVCLCVYLYMLGTLVHINIARAYTHTHTHTSSIPIEQKKLLPHLDWQREHILTPIKKKQSATICSEQYRARMIFLRCKRSEQSSIQ